MKQEHRGANVVRRVVGDLHLDPDQYMKERGWSMKLDLSSAKGLLGLEGAEASISKTYRPKKRKGKTKGKSKPVKAKIKILASATVSDVSYDNQGYHLELLMCSIKDATGAGEGKMHASKITIAPSISEGDWRRRVHPDHRARTGTNEVFLALLHKIAKEADKRVQKLIKESQEETEPAVLPNLAKLYGLGQNNPDASRRDKR